MLNLFIQNNNITDKSIIELSRIEKEYILIFNKSHISFLDVEKSKQLIKRWKQLNNIEL